MKRANPTPVASECCQTCPFRAGSPNAYLAETLAASALTEASRICHSTGPRNAINPKPGKPARLCRGARDVQLKYFHAIGFIAAPTDAAWRQKLVELGMTQ